MDELTTEEIKDFFRDYNGNINFDNILFFLAEILNNKIEANDAYRKVCEHQS